MPIQTARMDGRDQASCWRTTEHERCVKTIVRFAVKRRAEIQEGAICGSTLLIGFVSLRHPKAETLLCRHGPMPSDHGLSVQRPHERRWSSPTASEAHLTRFGCISNMLRHFSKNFGISRRMD